MNIKELHTQEKPVSAIAIFKSELGNATAIQILQGEKLKEHITKTPALLICIKGEAIFENENGIKEVLLPGDYVNIEPMVKHWVVGTIESQLILIK
jgi:quercetin dioxygenase-like cupin family protein